MFNNGFDPFFYTSLDFRNLFAYNVKYRLGVIKVSKIKVGITLDEDLLCRMDEYADENYLNRSSLISLAVTQFLNSAAVTKAISDMAFSMRKIADSGKVDDETQKQLCDFERLSKMLLGAK